MKLNQPLTPPTDPAEMAKVANQTPGILKAASDQLRSMAVELVDATREKEAAQHELSAMKIARRMEERGLEQGLSYQEKVAALYDSTPEKLAHIESAVELASGGFSLGRLSEEEGAKVAASSDDLDAFILSGAALNG